MVQVKKEQKACGTNDIAAELKNETNATPRGPVSLIGPVQWITPIHQIITPIVPMIPARAPVVPAVPVVDYDIPGASGTRIQVRMDLRGPISPMEYRRLILEMEQKVSGLVAQHNARFG